MSPGAIDRLMPSTPSLCSLPKLSLSSLSCGVALSVTCTPPRSTSMFSVSPALTLTMRCMSAEAVDLLAVDGEHQIARLEAGGLRGACRLHRIDARAGGLLADDHENAGENDDRQDEIRDRAGRHHGGARADRLVDKADFFFCLAHGGGGLMVGHARRIVVAEEFHIAAERHRGDFPARAVAVVRSRRFRGRSRSKRPVP